ncbi:MAG: four helix bundle protein [Deltaproteobacteria bacterium]|nr:four helix bundle protein [Deltaproteobacteria bacterium]
MGHDELPLFVLWEKVLGDLLDRTQKFPKNVRFTFSSRIDNLALDTLDRIVQACYASGGKKRMLLKEIDMLLVRLRILTRVCFERRFLDRRGYEQLARNLDEAGKMVGGWRRTIDEPRRSSV